VGRFGPETLPSLLPMASIFRGMIEAIEHGGTAQPDFVQAFHVQQVVETAYAAIAQERTLPVA
jgi:predicted dehydrogenase